MKKLKLREKSKAATESAIWFNDYDNRCQKTADKLCKKQTADSIGSDAGIATKRNTSTLADHQIRIAVNFDYEKCCVKKHLELHPSLSSAGTVSIPAKQQVEAYNELVVLQQLNDQQENYTEKAIDVPKEFEENAYSELNQNDLCRRQRGNQYSLVSVATVCSERRCVPLKIRINSQNHINRTRPQTEYIASAVEDLNMGNGCSYGNFRQRRHNAIAPRHPTKLHDIAIGDATTKSQFSLATKPPRLSTTRGEFPKRIGCPKPIDGLVHVVHAAAPVPVKHPDTHNRNSLIDENSILSDTNDTPRCSITKVKPFVRSTSVDSATTEAIIGDHDAVDDMHVKNENRHLSKLYRQISGSVQSLFQTNLSFSKKRQLSASDTNLNVCGATKNRNNRLLLSQQQLVDSNYCPSVLYSRKSRNATSELNSGKTQTFNRWKNHLWLRVTRRKSDSSIRTSKT